MKREKGINWLLSELPDMVNSGVISQDIAEKIRGHYTTEDKATKISRIIAIFGVIGAIFIGLGVILLFAFNWDHMGRIEKTIVSFVPLILSQFLAGRYILKGEKAIGAREGLSMFNMLATGATIALISQVYQLPSDAGAFMLTWMILSIPIVYLFEANVPALLYLIGITQWATISQIEGGHAFLFWPLLAAMIPHFKNKILKSPYSSGSVWFNWAACICVCVAIGISMEKVMPGLWIIVYSSFLAFLYLAGAMWFDDAPSAWQKSFKSFGALGVVILSYILSFEWAWKSIGWRYYRAGGKFHEWVGYIDYIVLAVSLFFAVALLIRMVQQKREIESSLGVMPIVSILAYSLVSGVPNSEMIAMWTFNFYVFAIGVICIVVGVRVNRLGIVNAGMFIASIMILTRFMDGSVGIIERAIVFIVLGVAFLGVNNFLSKRIKELAHAD